LAAASVPGIEQRCGQKYMSPELYLGTQIETPGAVKPSLGLVRGVTVPALLVRRQVQIDRGDWSEFLQHRDAAVVGRAVARRRGLEPGDKFSIGGVTVQLVGRRRSR
jgi:hypothetical protein